MRRPLILVAVFVLTALCVTSASALELVMFRRAGCPWCAAWDREVGPIYPKTEIGRRAPIRFVDLDSSGTLNAMLKSPVRFTPTFVLLDEEREIGRIEGYPGADFFWGLLENLVPKPQAKRGRDAAGAGH